MTIAAGIELFLAGARLQKRQRRRIAANLGIEVTTSFSYAGTTFALIQGSAEGQDENGVAPTTMAIGLTLLTISKNAERVTMSSVSVALLDLGSVKSLET